MSGGYGDIDLSSLSAPDVVESLDYEQVLADMVADLQAVMPDFDATLESDPAMKVLQVAAYREVNLRQRVNDAARAVMLAHSKGSDLDQLAALFGVERQMIDPGDPDKYPPIPPTHEDDTSLRRRTQLSLEGQTVAGSEGAYIFHALSVAGVKDASVDSPNPGEVVVTVLGLTDQGVPSADLLASVLATLDNRTVRPLTDQVTVEASTIIEYAIEATLTIGSGPDAAVVIEAAQSAIEALTIESHKLGQDVNVSAIYAALHQEGVQKVELTTPVATVAVASNAAAYCTGITLSQGGA
jgi:phage-related baseplate assembly protein